MTELWAHTLTWQEVDPLQHFFELDEDAVQTLTSLVVPLLPSPEAADKHRQRSLEPVTKFLVDRYGRWVCGGNWSVCEGDTDGGVVDTWCCAVHSVTTSNATAPLAVAALLEWQGGLEDLAERFAALAPPAHSAGTSVDPWHWERARTRLVTVMADRTQAESGWYEHCMQILGCFLAYNGIDEERAREIARTAVGGRFGSWTAPDVTVVDAVSSQFARTVGEER